MAKSIKAILFVAIVIAAMLILYNRYLKPGYVPTNPNTNYKPMEESQTQQSIFPEPNKPPYYYVKLHDSAELDGRWSLKFLKVVSDTRCPREANCAVSGPAIVQAQVIDKITSSEIADIIELKVNDNVRFPQEGGELYAPGFNPVMVKRNSPDGSSINWEVSLRDLVPYPSNDGKPIDPEEYIGLFHIEQLSQ